MVMSFMIHQPFHKDELLKEIDFTKIRHDIDIIILEWKQLREFEF